MSVGKKLLAVFTPKSPAEKIAKFTEELKTATAEVERLRAKHGTLVVQAMSGDDEAKRQIGALREEIAEAQRRVEDLQAAIGALKQAHKAEVEAALQREAAARPARVAAAVRKRLELIAQAESHAKALAATLLECNAAGIALADAIGTNDARRVYKPGAFRERVRATFAQHFALDASRPLADPENSILGLSTQALSHQSRRTLLDLEAEILDEIVRIYPTEGDANRAVARLAAKGEAVAVQQRKGGGFVLVEIGRLFAEKKDADVTAGALAQRGERVAVQAHPLGGFAIVPLEPVIEGGAT